MKPVLKFEQFGHRYTVDGVFKPSVTQVLEAAKLIDLAGIPTHILRAAGDRGTAVHKAGALLLRRELDWATIDPAIGGYVLALDMFLRQNRFTPDPETVEKPIYCAKYDYCGTPDVAGDWHLPRPTRSVRALLDWKTGMMPAVKYQLAAYAYPLGVRHRAAVKLNKDGTYRMHWFPPETLRQDFDTFRAALEETRQWA